MQRLTSADNGARIIAEPGESVEIRLPQLGGTGFVWSIASSSNIVVVDDQVVIGEAPVPPGEAATRVVRVARSSPDPGHIRLIRSRPWETADRRDAEFEVTLISSSDET